MLIFFNQNRAYNLSLIKNEKSGSMILVRIGRTLNTSEKSKLHDQQNQVAHGLPKMYSIILNGIQPASWEEEHFSFT